MEIESFGPPNPPHENKLGSHAGWLLNVLQTAYVNLAELNVGLRLMGGVGGGVWISHHSLCVNESKQPGDKLWDKLKTVT